MKIMGAEWQGRVKRWIELLKEELYEPLGEISWEACRVREHISPEEVTGRSFEQVSPGFTWGESWEYCWFRGRVILPEEAEGERIVLNVEPGGESTLFINGKSFGTYRSERVSTMREKHHFMEDNILTDRGETGQCYEILMETYAGHYYLDGPHHATGPVIPKRMKLSVAEPDEQPPKEGARRVLGRSTYGIWHEEAYQLYMDVETLTRLLTVLDDTSLRAAKIAEALECFTLTVEFEQDRERRSASYRRAREELRPVLEAENGSTMPVFYAVGNAHIDLAWLWPMAETHRKTARTFAAQLRLLELYPEYQFIQSQPAAYEMCREHYPELFLRIKAAIKEGRWIAEGGMWVEPDTNMAGGEALIRQLLYGKKYYKEEFGVDSQVLWLPDTFGYTAALPQILKGCGIKYLVTQKIFWSYNDGERFPYHYFNWQGMDGSEIVSFLPTDYTYYTEPVRVNTVWKERSQARDLDAFLLPFGYGDGGGGPSRDHIEYALRQKNLEGGVRVKLAGPVEFFEDMQAKGGPKNTYVGELYFTAHRGTYTTQAMVKKNNRRSELALREAELWSALASTNASVPSREGENSVMKNDYPARALERIWKKVLTYQFHDILPGSCIGRVYEEAEPVYNEILEEAEDLCERALRKLAEQERISDGDFPEAFPGLTVFNSLSFPRKVLVPLPEGFAAGAVTAGGEYIPVYGTRQGLKALVTLPSCGGISLRPATEGLHGGLERGQAESENPTEEAGNLEESFVLRNDYLRAIINRQGEVISLVLLESGREFAADAMNRFHLYKDIPRNYDAWDIDSNYGCQEVEGVRDVTVEVLDQGIETVLKVTGKIGCSDYTQYIRLEAGSRRLEFETEIDWRELHRLLKVAFPMDIHTDTAINEMQFGFVRRPTHRSRDWEKDRFEVPNHRYTALCDASHGGAVLNDCKYGVSMNGSSIELTLLRAASCPEMRTDNRRHNFTYAFTAWEGAFGDCDVVRQGYELNLKPKILPGSCIDRSFIQIDRENIILDTLKQAEDGSGDLILRLYEAKEAAVTAIVRMDFGGWKAYTCDMLENVTGELPAQGNGITLVFRAFEIKTVRLSSKEHRM